MYQPVLTKIEDPSRLKTEVGGKQGHDLRKRQKAAKTCLMKFRKTELSFPENYLQMCRRTF